MIVRCSNCQTQFSLDDQRVGPNGAAVRCTVCSYVFRLEPPADAAPKPWQVRTVEGQLFSAPDLPTLRDWAGEGRLHPDDEISRTSKHWIRLGDMPEFSDAFAGFSDLPEVLTPLGPATTDLGPPPMFGGAAEGADPAVIVEQMPDDGSMGIDVSGLLDRPVARVDEDEQTVARAAPDGIVQNAAHRDPSGELSAPLLPEDDAAQPRRTPRSGPSHPAAARKPKTATAKVRTLTAGDELASDESGVLRVLDVEDVDDEAPLSNRPPTSMLEAVTAHAKRSPSSPLTVDSGEGAAPPGAVADVVVDPTSQPIPAPQRAATGSPPPRERKRSMWPLVAGLGALCGAAIVFGIPQVRERVLGFAGGLVGHQPTDPSDLSEVQAVAKALSAANPDGLEKAARGALEQANVDGTGERARARLQLAAVEAETTRSIVLAVQGAVEPANNDVKFAAADASESAGQTFAGINVAKADPALVTRVRARLRLAQGRPTDEILTLVSDEADELTWLARGATLWDAGAADKRVPSGLIGGLAGLEDRTALAEFVLVMAYARSGDRAAATTALAAAEKQSPAHPLSVPLRAMLSDPANALPVPPTDTTPEGDDPTTPVAEEGGGAEAGAAEAGAAEAGGDEAGAAGDEAGAEEEPVLIAEGAAKPTMSVDKMISRGCGKVDSGSAKDGLKILLRAFDRRPNDIDVLVCLAEAHRKLGTHSTALRYYEKGLARNPKYRPALLGAARAASKAGQKDRALTFYRRLIAIAPSNAEAKAYITKREAETADQKAGKKDPVEPKPEPATPPADPAPAAPTEPKPSPTPVPEPPA